MISKIQISKQDPGNGFDSLSFVEKLLYVFACIGINYLLKNIQETDNLGCH